MKSNERPSAKKHHELLPGHVPTLAVTSPELIKTFDEGLMYGALDTRTKWMIQP